MMVSTFGSLEQGLSTRRIDGGECVGLETEGAISLSGEAISGICVGILEEGEV